jgi:hypothetical protein
LKGANKSTVRLKDICDTLEEDISNLIDDVQQGELVMVIDKLV